jgi:hypothetical protein
MQIEYNPENFVLIYQNSTWLTSTYCFIKVLCEWESQNFSVSKSSVPVTHRFLNNNPTGLSLKVNGISSPMILVTGAICDKKNYGNKKEWVSKTIDGLLFEKNYSYLYLHNNDVLGYYNFSNKIFTPFADNDVAHITMHQFFYRMMCLSDKTINWVSSQMNNTHHEYDESESNEVDCNDFDLADDSDSEEEVVVVLQTGPIKKKNNK